MTTILPHPFYLHPEHQIFLLFFALLFIALSALSTLLKITFTRAPYSLLIIFLWSLLLSLSFVGDYLLLPRWQFGVVLILLTGISFSLVVYTGMRSANSDSFLDTYRASNSPTDLVQTIILWGVGLFILLIPLAFGFPENTLVTSHFICHDSVVHSIMAGGIAYMKSRHIDPFYYSAAPRGIHSFIYYFHGLFKDIPISHIILPVTITSYSLTVLSADIFLRSFNISTPFRLLGALLPVCAFLPISAVYAIFLGQCSAVAPTFAAIAMSFASNKFGPLRQSLLLLAVITVGAISTYGLFSGSLIGFGILISCILWFYEHPSRESFRARAAELLSLPRTPLSLGLIIILFVLAYPSIRFALYVLEVQGQGSVASDLTSAIGNLPDGYLSPLHLSGLWPPGVGYREQLARNWSGFGSALLFIILVQFYFITRVSRSGFGLLLTLGIPCFATTILLNSPYVHFKYFTFFIVGYLVVSVAGFDLCRNKLCQLISPGRRILVSLVFLLALVYYEIVAVIYPLPTSTIIPPLSEAEFRTFEQVWQKVEGKRAMILTGEDWFQFGAGSDDFVPLVIYIPQAYRNTPLDALVVDRAWKERSLEYLKGFPKLLNLVHQQKCMTIIGDRFEVYLPKC